MEFTLKRKILISLVFVNVLVTITCIVVVQKYSEDVKKRMIEENLKGTTSLIERQITAAETTEYANIDFLSEGRDQILIYDMNGELLKGMSEPEVVDYPLNDGELATIETTLYQYYLFDMQYQKEGIWIRIYAEFEPEVQLDNAVPIILLSVLPIILLGSVLISIFLSRMVFKPIEKLRQTAKEISESGDMAKRIEIKKVSSDEITKLADMMNIMFEKLEHSFEIQKNFTTDASHELRTPLAVLLTQAEFLQEQLGKDQNSTDGEKKAISIIQEKIRYMNQLVNSLLVIARMENNERRFIKERINFSELIQIVAEEMQEEAEEKNIKIFCEADQEIFLWADQSMLFRLIVNLIDNAIKYGKQNGTICLQLQQTHEEHIILSIKDDGIGIAEEELDRIWQRFYRAAREEKEDEKSNSLGLGLFMVKKIVELNDGQIMVESQLGEGTEFKIIW